MQDFASTALFVVVYLAFILASRRGWERKAIGLFPLREERQEARTAFLRIRDGVEQYLFVQTITGLMVAVLSWVAMAAVGLHDALFWAFLIFLAVYIPVAGGVFAGVAPPLFALVQFDGYGRAAILFIVLQLIGVIIGNVIYPRMQGRSLNLDPVMILLALAFWSAIWGVTGAFLSTPLTRDGDGHPGAVRRQPLDFGDPVGRWRSAAAEEQATGRAARREAAAAHEAEISPI